MTDPAPDPADLTPRTRDRGRRATTALALVQPDAPAAPPPDGAVLHPPAAPDPAARRWFVLQIWDEVRLAVRMYFDPRYRISRTIQFLLPVILGLFALNYFVFSVWVGAIPLLGYAGPILERIGCVVLGVLVYKLFARELARYRDVLDYLTRYGPR